MGIKNFIEDLRKSLGLETKKNGKKKSVENLLKKLESRLEKNEKNLDNNPNKKGKTELKQEKAILECQIKKGKEILK